jgi:hypothetical protein
MTVFRAYLCSTDPNGPFSTDRLVATVATIKEITMTTTVRDSTMIKEI